MTEKEIVKALRCISTVCSATDRDCLKCGYFRKWFGCDADRLSTDAADLIERLTAENVILPDGQASAVESLRKEIEWKDMVIALAQRKQAEAESERDAAIVDLKIFAGCSACRHCCNHRRDHQESLLLACCDCTKKQNCKCGSCSPGRSNWEWHGLQGAPEEGDKHE